jgi:hypothetical protein
MEQGGNEEYNDQDENKHLVFKPFVSNFSEDFVEINFNFQYP